MAQALRRSAAGSFVQKRTSIARVGSPRVAVRAQQQAKSADFQADFYEITQQLEALKSKLEGASSGAPAAPAAPAPKTEVNSLGYYCDENGCVLLTGPGAGPKASASGDSMSWDLDQELSGNGWVLGITGEADSSGYCASVGGSTWNVSLTMNELRDFVTALRAIRDAVGKLVADAADAGEGSEEGALPIKVKWTTKTVTMEAVATPAADSEAPTDAFRLSFQVGVGGLRLVRGSWRAEVVKEVLSTLDKQLPGFALAIPSA